MVEVLEREPVRQLRLGVGGEHRHELHLEAVARQVQHDLAHLRLGAARREARQHRHDAREAGAHDPGTFLERRAASVTGAF